MLSRHQPVYWLLPEKMADAGENDAQLFRPRSIIRALSSTHTDLILGSF